jgi:hypothetical protein
MSGFQRRAAVDIPLDGEVRTLRNINTRIELNDSFREIDATPKLRNEVPEFANPEPVRLGNCLAFLDRREDDCTYKPPNQVFIEDEVSVLILPESDVLVPDDLSGILI